MWRLVFIVLILAFLLPACGTKPLLKIGLAMPFTAYDQERGYNAIYAVKQAITEANARGGVGGYMVELVAVDDRNDPAEAVRQARELTLYDDLVAVIGHHGDDCTLSAIPAYRQAGMPLVAPWLVAEAPSPTSEGGPGWGPAVFRLAAPASTLGRQLADAVDAQRVAVLTNDSPDGRELAAAFAAGRRIIFQAEVARGQRDFAAVAKVQPDAVFYGGHATEAALLLLALREAGVTAPFLGGPDLDDPKFVQLAGDAAEGVAFVGLALPGGEPLAAGYRERTGHDPDDRAALAYDATVLLLSAIEHAIQRDGRPTRAGVAQSLREMPAHKGLTGPIAFDKAGQRRAAAGLIYVVTGGVPRAE